MAYTNVVFGSGELFAFTPTSPVQVRKCADLKDVSVEISAETIKLYGSKSYPNAVADGKRSITGKATVATWKPDLMASVLNATLSTASSPITSQTGTIGSTSIAVSGGGATTVDYGLSIAGVPATRLTSGTPSAGEYTYSAGTYTVASGDNGKAYALHTMTPAVTGYKIAGGNPTMGVSPTFKLVLSETDAVTSQKMTVTLYAVKFLGASMAFSSEDFAQPEISFEAFADSSGNTIDVEVTA